MIIDDAFKELDDEEECRWLLIQIGHCLVENIDVTIGLEEDDLWQLRNWVSPTVGGGKPNGLDIITKVYRLLLEIRNEELTEGLIEMPVAPLAIMEERNAEDKGSTSQSSAEDYAESAT